MTRKDNLIEELKLIQMQIQRMAQNSFTIKKWYITYISAFSVYVFQSNNYNLIFLGIFPIILFWLYDSFFLYLERLFICKYNWVIDNTNNDKFLFNLNPYNKEQFPKKTCKPYYHAVISKIQIFSYLIPLTLIIIYPLTTIC